MGVFDRWGRGRDGRTVGAASDPVMPAGGPVADAGMADEQAIARYRYMLRTAPPETIEQAHAEAFAQLSPGQRRKVLESLADELTEAERASTARDGASAGALARAATRAEIRRPGAIERVFGGVGGPGAPGFGAAVGPAFGGLMAGTLLSSLAGTVLGSVIAQQFFTHHPDAGRLFGDGAAGADGGRGAGPISDPWAGAPADADLGNRGAADDPAIVADPDSGFGGFDDGGSFDV
jgi:hypothetical protein